MGQCVDHRNCAGINGPVYPRRNRPPAVYAVIYHRPNHSVNINTWPGVFSYPDCHSHTCDNKPATTYPGIQLDYLYWPDHRGGHSPPNHSTALKPSAAADQSPPDHQQLYETHRLHSRNKTTRLPPKCSLSERAL